MTTTKKEPHPVGHVVYALWMDSGRIKIGYTSDFCKRLSYYTQEAQRHGVSHVEWMTWAALDTRGMAQQMERLFLDSLKWLRECHPDVIPARAIPRQREWFTGDKETFKAVCDQGDEARSMVERLRPFGVPA